MSLGLLTQAPATPPNLRVVGSGGARLLQQTDFTYLGSCVLPDSLSTVGESLAATHRADQAWGSGYLENEGLGYTVIGGSPYFLSTADARFSETAIQGEPFRFHCSSLSTTPATYPTATLDERYGDAFDCKRVYVDGSCVNEWWSGPGGLYVRNNGGTTELWWTFSPSPYGDDGDYASLGYSTLNIGSSSATGQAAYKFQNSNQALRTGSFIPIPSTWQSRFGRHTMMLTNKGIASNHGTPDPAIMVLDFPTGPHLSTIRTGYKQIMNYGAISRCSNTSKRMLRPSWLPVLHFNYWDNDPNPVAQECTPPSAAFNLANTLGNESADALLFIDTGTKYGVLTFNHWGLGGINYTQAAGGTGGWTTGWGVIDPNRLAEVYAGTRNADNVTYASTWAVQYPVFNYAAPPFQERIAPATISANGTTKRFRLTYSTPFHIDNTKEWINGYAAANPYFNRGYAVHEVITPDLVYDLCTGQACYEDCPHELPVCTVSDLKDVPASAITTETSSAVMVYGKVNGAVWMPTNSACGVDNSFAIAVDADAGSGIKRYIHCYRVN